MKKQIKYAIYTILTSVTIMLVTLIYWFQYYSLFSVQERTDSFLEAINTIFFGGFNFILWSLGEYPAGNIVFCAAAAAAILAFFWLVETKLFKDRKWAFLTAPMVSSAVLLAFALGGSIVSNQIVTDLYNTKPSSGCMDIFYGGNSFDSFFTLPYIFSMLILEMASAAFLLLIVHGAIKRKGWNKFLVVSALLLILAQPLFYVILPLLLVSL